MMTKLSLSISRALLLGALLILPIAASAQAPVDEKQAEFERQWYDTCYTKKDIPKCQEMSKTYASTYPNGTYIKNATGIVEAKITNDLWEQFKADLDAFYKGPDLPKLNKLLGTGDALLPRNPGTYVVSFVTAQQALAGVNLSLAETFPERPKVLSYLDKGVTTYTSPNTPDAKGMDQAQWANFRDLIMASAHQLHGFHAIQTKAAPQVAIDHLTKATMVKSASNPNIGWKDPNNYWLRSTVVYEEYAKLQKQYQALPDDQKTGDSGKEILKQINAVVDRLLADYARVMATATSSDTQELKNAAKGQFDPFWKYRTDAPEKAAAYLQSYVADPTIADVAVPAKVETAESAPPSGPPTGAGGTVKLSAGGKPMSGTATNGGKATAAPKAKPAPKGKKKR
jgi:hypothetical protein